MKNNRKALNDNELTHVNGGFYLAPSWDEIVNSTPEEETEPAAEKPKRRMRRPLV